MQIAPINISSTTVDDGLLFRADGNKLLAQRHKEFRFEGDRVSVLTVVLRHIHSVDMVVRGCRKIDDFAAQRADKRAVFSLRINDDNIRIGRKPQISNIALGKERFTAARNAENKSVAVKELLTVSDNHILRYNILTVVNALFVEYFFRTERHQYRKRFGCEGTQGINLANAERERGVQTVHLLILQNRKLTKVLSGCREKFVGIVVELLFGVCRVYQCQNSEHHTLIARCQIVEKLLHLGSLLFHIIRNGSREIVVGILPALPIRYIGFDTEQTALGFTDSFIRRNRDNVNRHHHIAVKLRNLGNHTILDIRSVIAQEHHSAVSVADFEIVLFEFHCIGADIVLEAVSLLAVFLDIEMERAFLTNAVKVVNNAQALRRVKLYTLTAELFQNSSEIITNASKVVARVLDILLADRYRNILVLHHRI